MVGERYPASFESCVSVGATDQKGEFSLMTVQSPRTVVHAPGVDIESYDMSGTPTPMSGTSFSAPIAAGIAALAISYLKRRNSGRWNPDMLRQTIYDTATPLPGYPGRRRIRPLSLFNGLNP
jgi:subtilisin family serine protease